MRVKRHLNHLRPEVHVRAWMAGFLLILASLDAAAATSFLDNGRIKIGVRTDSGACIDYFGPSAGPNTVNSYDRGRYIQQSYYGNPDGSTWSGHPWRWNPVQGGGANGQPSRLLAFKNSGGTIYAKTMPKRWSTGADAPNMVMEEWIELRQDYAHIHYKMSYTGSVDHKPAWQEVPAVFLNSSLNTLVYYKGNNPWSGGPLQRKNPPTGNQYDDIDENWAAYINPQGWGVGVYVPKVERMTYYRAGKHSGPGGDGCSYLAPLLNMGIGRGSVFEYDVYLTLGNLPQIRRTIYAIHHSQGS